MQINVRKVDLRRDGGSTSIDDENGNLVGQLLMEKTWGRTIIILGKYRANFKSQEECQAFADGVTAVLNHMTAMDMKGLET
jgi:hypothetical protein